MLSPEGHMGKYLGFYLKLSNSISHTTINLGKASHQHALALTEI